MHIKHKVLIADMTIVILLLLWLLAVAGYVLNLVELIQSVPGPLTTLVILRMIGLIFFPVGAFLGFVY